MKASAATVQWSDLHRRVAADLPDDRAEPGMGVRLQHRGDPAGRRPPAEPHHRRGRHGLVQRQRGEQRTAPAPLRTPPATLTPSAEQTRAPTVVVGLDGHREGHPGCLSYGWVCGQSSLRAMALTHAPKSAPCAMACSGAMPATCCPKAFPPPGATSWAIPGAAAPSTSPVVSNATPTTRRSIANSLLRS